MDQNIVTTREQAVAALDLAKSKSNQRYVAAFTPEVDEVLVDLLIAQPNDDEFDDSNAEEFRNTVDRAHNGGGSSSIAFTRKVLIALGRENEMNPNWI